ncbi:MAG: PAAR domain-containing protein [Polyangiaceae bacterium]
MPPAARISDMHACPKVEPGPVPHVGGPVNTGEPTVLIGFMPAARVGDMAICVGPPDSVKKGEPTVKIGGKEAARLGDPMSHGGVIVAGCPTVIIGSGPQAEALHTDKPFCEECERKKIEREARKKKRPSRASESS